MLDSYMSNTYAANLENCSAKIQAEHSFWMTLALQEAQKAEQLQEVPIGAVLVSSQGKMLSRAHNMCISTHNPCGHAEILAIQKAAQSVNNYRLPKSVLYVTLEPCIMCLGAMVQARISGLVFGTRDPKAGSIVSNLCAAELSWLNHYFLVQEGLLARDCSQILKDFFAGLRVKKVSDLLGQGN